MSTVLTYGFLLTLLSAYSQPLSTVDRRIHFLHQIYLTHETTNNYEDSIMATTGFRSEEHLLAIDSVKKTDSILVREIDQYLNTFGYPDKEKYGEIANITPWYILQQTDNHKVKMSQFNHLYKAYKKEDLELRRLIKYLESEYEFRHRRNYKSMLRDEERLEDLMNALNVQLVKL